MRISRLLIVLAATAALTVAWAAEAAADPVIAAAGDIACDPADPDYNNGRGTRSRCRQRATSDLLLDAPLAAVLPLGDIQYEISTLANINAAYDPTWGRVKSISRPVLGNHEGDWTGYFDYFNGPGASQGPAGETGKGYYSFDLGSWHLIALNTTCGVRVPCSAGSEQERWLRSDLAATASRCTLAYWHHPRYSSGHDGNSDFVQPLWELLYDAGAEVVLSGHSHHYERFAPIGRHGGVEPARGIRQFVVGTGGAFHTGLLPRVTGSEVSHSGTFGVLMLTLHPGSYEWRFVPEEGETFADSGSGECHEGSRIVAALPGDVQPGSQPGPAGPAPPVAPWAGDKLVRLSRRAVVVGRRGIAALRVRCLGSARCRGTLTLSGSRRRRPSLGRARFSIAGGRSELVRVKLSRRGRVRLLRAGRLRCRVTLAMRVSGRRVVVRTSLILRAR